MKIRQIGFQAMCTHNPNMDQCNAKGCSNVLFGEIMILQLENEKCETRSWEMCSLDCYKHVDQRIEAWMSSKMGDDLVAIIDNGIPEDWE